MSKPGDTHGQQRLSRNGCRRQGATIARLELNLLRVTH
jgi:hypothetical protein